MKIATSNRQKCCRLNLPKLKRLAAWFLDRPPRPRRQPGWVALLLVLTDNPGMRTQHARWMGTATDTDVLSGHYDALPGEPAGRSGEIILNVERALELGPRYWPGAAQRRRNAGVGPSPSPGEWELALYLAHGCDHLRGADDATPDQRRRMRQREQRWLDAAHRAGLIAGLVLESSPPAETSHDS